MQKVRTFFRSHSSYRDGLSGTGTGNAHHVTTLQSNRPADGLNGCWLCIPTLLDSSMDKVRKAHLIETMDRFRAVLSADGDLILGVESGHISL